ncbi:MAG: HNH endonuclease [Anaerolineae bacterium]|nr:HNH endonuclease [Anaerolineales bacterium]MCQ3980148.1 HNH endonuclease [Anaerolineae bacterium]
MIRSDLWTREQLLLVLNLYHKIPFGQFDHRNPKVIRLAEAIGRTPGAVSRKLGNFASLDPYHQNRGVKGLSNAGKATEDIWKEFYDNWDQLVPESEALFEALTDTTKEDIKLGQGENAQILDQELERLTEIERSVKVRMGQRFFRQTVMASYHWHCCVCGIPIPELLIASHIIPWKDREDLRLNPHNGLCLCALHDKAFDRGFMTINSDYMVLISPVIYHHLPQEALNSGLIAYQNCKILLPDRFLPDKNFLEVHQHQYFLH